MLNCPRDGRLSLGPSLKNMICLLYQAGTSARLLERSVLKRRRLAAMQDHLNLLKALRVDLSWCLGGMSVAVFMVIQSGSCLSHRPRMTANNGNEYAKRNEAAVSGLYGRPEA